MQSLVFVASSWGVRHGGINAFNADLVEATAQAVQPGISVLCVVLDAQASEIESARRRGVTLLPLTRTDEDVVATHRVDEIMRRCAAWGEVLWWIGHDLVSGAVCVEAARRSGGRAAVIQHTNYPAYASLKDTAGIKIVERRQNEAAVLHAADAVFGVGPKLTRAAADVVRRRTIEVQQLLPGLATFDAYPTPPKTFRAITFGRLDPVNDRVKQGHLAVAAFGRFIREAGDIARADPQIVVVGLDGFDGPDGSSSEEQALRALASKEAHRSVAVIGHPFTESRPSLFELLADTSVCLMLSTHEGFGLTGWEAIAGEVPLILSENTGLYDFLHELGGAATGCVHHIDIRGQVGEVPYSKRDLEGVARLLREVAFDPESAKRDARALKDLVRAYTWKRTAGALLTGLGLTDAGAAPTAASPTGVSAPLPASNLGSLADEYFGRELLLTEVADLIREGHTRHVTVVGPPGTGKTRFGHEVAAALMKHFDNHVYLVDLTTVADPDLVISSITQALKLQASHPLLDALKEFFKDRRALILLDNFEQVLPAARSVAELLAAVPDLTVLATSRAPMRIAGEVERELKTLDLADAVALFDARTGSRYASSIHRSVIEAICKRVDCLPLAVELVAARAEFYTPADLLRLLDESVVALSAPRRDVPEKQRSLRAAIDWSYRLLEPAEQELFRKLSIFDGGWSLSTASAIVDSDHAPTQSADHMFALLDNRLVNGEAASEPVARFSMFVSLREFAAQQLRDSNPALPALLAARHAAYFLELAESRSPDAPGINLEQALTDLGLEQANISTALAYFVTKTETMSALRLARAMGRYWWSREYAEGYRQLTTVLALPEPGELSDDYPSVRADVLILCGMIAIRQCALADAEARFMEALAIGASRGSRQLQARALSNLALVDMDKADHETAAERLEKALKLFTEQGDVRGRADCLDGLAIINADGGRHDEALDLFMKARELYNRLNDEQDVAWVHNGLAQLYLLGGDLNVAQHHAEQALQVGRAERDRGLMLWSTNYLGLVYSAQGDYEKARDFHRESLSMAILLGNTRPRILAIEGLTLLAARLGKEEQARALRQAVDVMRARTGLKRTHAESRLIADTDRFAGESAERHPSPGANDVDGVSLEQATDLARQV